MLCKCFTGKGSRNMKWRLEVMQNDIFPRNRKAKCGFVLLDESQHRRKG